MNDDKICKACHYWLGNRNGHDWSYGICNGLRENDSMEIEIDAGWEGGTVSRIETKITFSCGDFKQVSALQGERQ